MKKALLAILAAGLFSIPAFGQRRQLLFPPGTALFPGLAVDSDRKSGLFQKDASTLGFAVNGAESFFFTKNTFSAPAVSAESFFGPWVQFDLTFEDGAVEGRLQWNIDDGTLDYGLPGGEVVLQIGQEHVIRVRNESGNPIPNGSVVYATGVQGGRLTIDLADASSFPEFQAMGVATEDIGNNSFGYITVRGVVRDVNTLGMTAGASLFLSETTPGAYTEDRPTPPNFKVAVGSVVTVGQENGTVLANIIFVPQLIALTDVKLEFPTMDGQFVRWDTTNSRFELGGVIHNGTILHANLPAGENGDQIYCSDCKAGFSPCISGGAGSLAFRENGAWNCKEIAVPAYGEIYVSTPAGTSNTSGTPLKALGTTTLGDAAQFDMPANNRLRYTGAETLFFHCSVNVAADSDANNLLLEIYLADNGTADLTTEIDRWITTPSDHGAMGTGFIVELEQNEYVELWVDSSTGNPTITVDHMTLRCTKQN